MQPILLALHLMVSTTSMQESGGPFEDLAIGSVSHDHKTGVPELMELGVFRRATVWPEFRPDDPMTRIELASVFSRLLALPKAKLTLGLPDGPRMHFEDVPRGHWGYDALGTVSAYGLTDKRALFRPTGPVTKLELCRWLHPLMQRVGKRGPYGDSVRDLDPDLLPEADKAAVRAIAFEWRLVDLPLSPTTTDLSKECSRVHVAGVLIRLLSSLRQ